MIGDNVLLTAKFVIIVAIKITLNQSANLRLNLNQIGQEILILIENVANVVTKRVDCVEYSQESDEFR